MRITDNVLEASSNNFTAVRLILASAVIYSHSYGLIYNVENKDNLGVLLGQSIAVYAVDGFFFLSGFLVYPSLLRLEKSSRFLMARLARLWPGLALSIFLTVVIGLAFTSSHGLAYFRGETTRFVGENLTFLKGAYALTGVKCGVELCVVNGSLWTLPWEARCYLLLAALWMVGLGRPALMRWLVLPATLIAALAWDAAVVRHSAYAIAGPGAVWFITDMHRLWTAFALGVAAYVFRSRLSLSWIALAALFAAAMACRSQAFGEQVRTVFIGYAVLCCGLLTARKGSFSSGWPDYSYGVYIYAFPVMMAVQGVFPTRSYLLLFAETFVATLPFAVVSWHCVEQPALEAFKRFRRRNAARPRREVEGAPAETAPAA